MTRAAPSRKTPRRRLGRPPEGFDARAEILRGAARAFGRRGYARTTVEDVCRAGGISRRTFYRFFRDKEAAFEALFDLAVGILVGSVRSAVAAAATPVGMVEAGVEAYLRVQASAGGIATSLVLEALRPGSKFARRKEEVVAAVLALLDAEMARLGRPAADPLLLRALFSALEQITLAIQAPEGVSEESLQRAKRAMVRIIAASLAGPDDPVPPLPLRER